MKEYNFCNNCGKHGHLFHQCKNPITSIGIIVFNNKNVTDIEYLMIRRKDSLGYVDFMRGKYPLFNKRYLLNIISEMTDEEKTKLLTNDFVIPIMYSRGCLIKEAWREFWQLLMSNKGPFTLYLLFLLVIGLAIGMIVLLAVLVTCCCAACFLMIPYIGTVVMLPILVWRRAYSLLYLSQYGPEFDVFVPKPTPVVVPTVLIPPEQNP